MKFAVSFRTTALILVPLAIADSAPVEPETVAHAHGFLQGIIPKLPATTRSETTIVRAGPPMHRGVGRLVQELSIGTLDGREPYAFGSVTGIAIGPDESIYVADERGPSLRKFDRAGKFVRSFGRPGNGPGEYGVSSGLLASRPVGPRGVALTPQGAVIAHVPGGHRVNFYHERGDPLLARRDPRLLYHNRFLPESPPVLVARDSILYVRLWWVPRGFKSRPGRPIPPGHYGRWRLDGTPIDTVIEPTNPFDTPFVFTGPRDNPKRHREVPFVSKFAWTLSPLGYFVTALSAEYGGHYSLDLRVPIRHAPFVLPRWLPGDPVTSIRVPYTKVPLRSGERNDWRDATTAYLREVDRSWRWNGPDIPLHKPAFIGIWADESGRIWVSLSSVSRENPLDPRGRPEQDGHANPLWPMFRWPDADYLFDIVEPTGRYVGRVRVTDRIYPQAARGDRLWAIVETTDGPLTVRRYRIVWSETPE